MDATRFDILVASLVRHRGCRGHRRGLLGFLAALPLAGPFGVLVTEEGAAAQRQKDTRHGHGGGRRKPVGAAKKKHKRKHKQRHKMCAHAGQSTSRRRTRCCAGLVKQGTLCTQPSSPPPSCPPGGCPANTVCHTGACQPCDVICTGTPAACGEALQAALDGSASTIYVCPGRYQPPSAQAQGFSVTKSKTVIGAGQGKRGASNTILDANGAGGVLQIVPPITGATVVLAQLRITGGNKLGVPGGGIEHLGGTLQMTDCSVIGNTTTQSGAGGGIFSNTDGGTGLELEMTRCTVANNSATVTGSGGSTGGGIWIGSGTFTLTDCLVEDNHANSRGGGILFSSAIGTLNGTTEISYNTATLGGGIYADSGSLTIAESCRVTNNSAAAVGDGGGINNAAATVRLQGASPSPIVVNNCRDNCAGSGLGLGLGPFNCAPEPTSC